MKRIGLILLPLFLYLLGLPSYSEAALSTPTGVTATKGTYSDVIVVAWVSVPDASGYEIWRSSSTCEGADPCEPYFIILGVVDSPIYFDSADIMPFGEVFEYQILAFNYLEWSRFSLSAFGYVSEDSPSYGPELPENNFESAGCFITAAANDSHSKSHGISLRRLKDSHLLANKHGVISAWIVLLGMMTILAGASCFVIGTLKFEKEDRETKST